MAEREKTEEAVESEPDTEDGKGNAEEKKENGVVEFPGKPDPNGSEEHTDSPASGKEDGSVQKADVPGVEKSPVAPVNGLGESPPESPVEEAAMEDLKEQNGERVDGKDEEPEAEGADEETEGSRSLHSEHWLLKGWRTMLVVCKKK